MTALGHALTPLFIGSVITFFVPDLDLSVDKSRTPNPFTVNVWLYVRVQVSVEFGGAHARSISVPFKAPVAFVVQTPASFREALLQPPTCVTVSRTVKFGIAIGEELTSRTLY